MKSFYAEYKDDDEFVQLVAQIPWKHNIILMQKLKIKTFVSGIQRKLQKNDGWKVYFYINQILIYI